MARIYRPTITRYVDAEGKRCNKNTPGAKQLKTKSKTWRGEYRDADGILTTEKLCSNKQAAQTMLAERMRAVQSGDPFHQHRKRSLKEHVDEFESALIAKGGTEQHARQTASRVRSIVEGCRFKLIRDINASRVSTWLKEQRDLDGEMVPTGKVVSRYVDQHGNKCRKSKRGARKIEEPNLRQFKFNKKTSNGYLVAFKSFCNWLLKDGRSPSNPVAHLSRINAKSDARIVRRAATSDELARLIEAAECGPTIRGLAGLDRAMLYRVASGTGFRADELASLKASSFNLDSDPATITVDAAYSKRRREDVQPIASHLAEMVRPWLASRSEADQDDSEAVLSFKRNTSDSEASFSVWPGTWAERAADMIREDLSTAGIPFETEDGRLDFHSLRHSYISGLASAGIHPKTAQELARHSDINLTMNVYTHIRLNDLSVAVDTVPAPVRDDQPEKMVAGMVAGLNGNHSDLVRKIERRKDRESDPAESGLTASLMRNDDDCDQLKMNGAGGTRTHNQRIMSP